VRRRGKGVTDAGEASMDMRVRDAGFEIALGEAKILPGGEEFLASARCLTGTCAAQHHHTQKKNWYVRCTQVFEITYCQTTIPDDQCALIKPQVAVGCRV
jgi:hypothetical protein